MNKSYILIFIILLYSFSFIESSNLRKALEIPEINTLLKGLPMVYESLLKYFKIHVTTNKNLYKLSYFKSLESNAKVKYYLNKEKKDFDSIKYDIITSMGINNPDKAFVNLLFEEKIFELEKELKTNTWMNFNIISTLRNEKDSLAYGSLFVNFKDKKYNFIFCHGFGYFKKEFNSLNAVFLGKEGEYKFAQHSAVSSSYEKDFSFYHSNYLIMFMNLLGFKALGNKYNVQLPNPNLD